MRGLFALLVICMIGIGAAQANLLTSADTLDPVAPLADAGPALDDGPASGAGKDAGDVGTPLHHHASSDPVLATPAPVEAMPAVTDSVAATPDRVESVTTPLPGDTNPTPPAQTSPTHGHAHSHAHDDPNHIIIRPADSPQPLSAPADRTLEFVCPESDVPGGGLGIIPMSNPEGDDPVVHGCPIRVYDTGYSFGNPHLVINHNDHREVAFFSLHGAPTNNGPSDQSRTGLTHVSFTSRTQGLYWQDQPTDAPNDRGALGDFPSGAMDSSGNLYAAFLWHSRQPSGGEWDPFIGLFKGPTTQERSGMDESYRRGHFIAARDTGNSIHAAHLIQLPPFTPVVEETDGNRTAPPTTDDDNREPAVPGRNATDERIVLVWHEAAVDWRNSTTGMSGWIEAAWTHTGSAQNWTRLNTTSLIGPCRAASNPVTYEDKVYVACVVDRGYQDRARALVGDVDIWSIDVFSGRTELVGSSGLEGGQPMLAMTTDGYMGLLVQSQIRHDDGTMERLDIRTAFSWYGRNWSPVNADMGRELRRIGDTNMPLLDAHITAFTITNDEKTAMIVYKEWHDSPQEPQNVDLEDPASIISNNLLDYNKFLLTFNQCTFPIAGAKMQLGTAVDANNAQAYASNPAVFNDKQDGLMVSRDPGGRELVFFAINDYGAVQYGAVDAFAASEICFIPPPPPFIPPVPVAQALSLANPYTMAVGAAVAVPAVAMVAYLLTVKRRVAQFVTVEDK